jgi:hypothetical protein
MVPNIEERRATVEAYDAWRLSGLAEIQYWQESSNHWADCHGAPCWDRGTIYRIKPAPPEVVLRQWNEFEIDHQFHLNRVFFIDGQSDRLYRPDQLRPRALRINGKWRNATELWRSWRVIEAVSGAGEIQSAPCGTLDKVVP